MATDILYVSFNRLRYTRESFAALVDFTDWGSVSQLFIADDGSTDGTREYLVEAARDVPVPVRWIDDFGGPVAATNAYLDRALPGADDRGVDRFAKIDNDMVVCPGWLEEMLRQLTRHPELDIIGMEPRHGPAVEPPFLGRGNMPAEFIGGKGIIRHRAFEQCRPVPRARVRGGPAYFGFTEWQRAHPQITKAWIAPDLPVFGLDQLPISPWPEVAAEYEAAGWQRSWPPYDGLMDGYWSWWTPETVEATA